ncbi:hypothetical protein BBW65_02155 [Helicobacter enhydrae]|uniref:Autotransporter domain-containing protein n=1 Tax=Helicobacter enhydrae TaxID=222136 RepID=A0A1B1U4J8_9HELI|nr:autotransporter outer membrane beta-barrel domain-containing protein [Helicobacter enhydrae]ANV97680.1 hypothetical protein BBW65_02155 [Helicobacter enhydrae]
MRIYTSLVLSSLLYASAQTPHSSIAMLGYELIKLHTNAPNPHLLALKSYPLEHQIWLKTNYAQHTLKATDIFTQMQVSSIQVSGGYDYAFGLGIGDNLLGLGVQYAHINTSADSFGGVGNALGLLLYDSLVFENRLYIDLALQYNLTLQDLNARTYTQHLGYGSMEIGYLWDWQSWFLLPSLKASMAITTQSQEIPALTLLNLRAGSYIGTHFGGIVRGDVRLGAFYDFDRSFEEFPPALEYLQSHRLYLTLETDVFFNAHFGMYAGIRGEFFGYNEPGFDASVGVRFGWGGTKAKHSSKPSNTRTLEQVKLNQLNDANQRRQRWQALHYLKESDINKIYNTQDNRNGPNVKEELELDTQKRKEREAMRYIDTEENEANYQNRNLPELQQKELQKIYDYNKRELERKYGK